MLHGHAWVSQQADVQGVTGLWSLGTEPADAQQDNCDLVVASFTHSTRVMSVGAQVVSPVAVCAHRLTSAGISRQANDDLM